MSPARPDKRAVLRALEDVGVVAVVRLEDGRVLREVVDALGAGGVYAIEITMTVPNAVALIGEMARTLSAPYLVGAGTVLDRDTADQVIDAGAAFVVSPVLNTGVIDACRARGVAVMPGCFTPTEILAGFSAGGDVIKVFPATALGPAYFKDLKGPLPQIPLMPTGGVTRENAGDWIRAGAVALGVGTALVDRAAVKERRFDDISAAARHFVAAVAAARSSAPARP